MHRQHSIVDVPLYLCYDSAYISRKKQGRGEKKTWTI